MKPATSHITARTVMSTFLYPNYFHSDEFFGIINRIGAREIYSTDIAECDRLNGGAVFSELFGAIVCSMGVSFCSFCCL